MSPLSIRRSPLDLLLGYYLATPLFAVADLVFGVSMRVAGLDDPVHRGVYYAATFACGLLCRARPRLTPWVGMLESSANLLLLMLSVLLPIWSLPDAFLAGEPLRGPFDERSLLNVIISGVALVVAFHRHQSRALRKRVTRE